MPLTKRLVEPVDVSRERIPAGIRNELEYVTNATLANMILQLSNLSKHAEDIFGELHREALGFSQRAVSLQNRIDRLAAKVTQLDSSAEEVALQDINQRKQFRSANNCDDRVVSRETLPNAMKDVYEACDSPPPLHKLNKYRTDGKDGMKFYTDPDYFFDLWKHEMLTSRGGQRVEKSKKPGRARTPSENKGTRAPRQPQSHIEQMRAKAMANDMGYVSPSPPNNVPMTPKSNYPFSSDQYGALQNIPTAASYDANRYGTISRAVSHHTRPVQLDLPPPYDNVEGMEETVHMVDYRAPGGPGTVSSDGISRAGARGTPTRPSQPPPAPPSNGSTSSLRSTPTSSREAFPPPPPEMHEPTPPPHHDFPPPPGMETVHQQVTSAPPPPPPPPIGGVLPIIAPGPSTPSSTEHHKRAGDVGHQKPAPVQVSNTMLDARSDLLAAIRKGIHLRKVEQQNEQQSTKMEEKLSSLHNVAEIIQRRKAMEHSDSESSQTEADSDWDENH